MSDLKFISWISGTVAGLLLSGCFTSHADSPTKEASVELPKVATVTPERKTLIQKTVQPGQIEAFHTTPIYAKVGGFVDQLSADIGDRVQGPQLDESGRTVKTGQLLARLAAPELAEELQQKEALVAQAATEVEQFDAAVKVAQSQEESAAASIAESQAGLQRAQANVERWKSELERVRDLAEKKALTQKLADETEHQSKSAEASLAEAAAKVRSSEAKYRELLAVIQKSHADLKTANARLSVAKTERERVAALHRYLEIRAPYSGVVTARNTDLGVLVLPAHGGNDVPLFIVVQADQVRLFVEVPEADSVLVEIGRPVTVKVPALGSKPFSGTVARTGWALQSGTRTLNCEIDVPNSEGTLRPGMYANIELVVAKRENVLSLPKSAVITSEGQTACLTVTSDGLIERKTIEVGIRTDADVEIASGLEGTESVISVNASAFHHGQKVQTAAR